jgi:iron-sulfur cluster repair protein YtfE (RIC family)
MNSSNPVPEEKDSLLASCNILARELVVHAQKEDSQLYPKIKEIMFNMQ